MSNPISDMSLLLLMASTAVAELCTGKNAEDCKVDNTARLTWTLLGVLMLINLLLFCMLSCTWYYLCTRMRDLRRKIGVVSTSRRVAGNGYVVVNTNSVTGDPVSRTQAPTRTTTINTSVSEPIALSSRSNPVRNSGDYSTVADAIISSQSHGRKYSVSKMCPPLLKPSKSAAGQSAHPFSHSADTTNSVNKADNQKRPQRVAPPIPIARQGESDPKTIGEHNYDNIVDEPLSPPEDADSAISSDPKSPPKSTAKTTTSTHTAKNTATTATTKMDEEEIGSGVYSTPIPDGIKNYRRMTASQNKDVVISKSKTTTREKYSRPKSALGLYPPMDDIYTSSCNSSPSSVRKKMRPVSAYYNEPV